jgi:predicted RecA/RadA family phage recombinase
MSEDNGEEGIWLNGNGIISGCNVNGSGAYGIRAGVSVRIVNNHVKMLPTTIAGIWTQGTGNDVQQNTVELTGGGTGILIGASFSICVSNTVTLGLSGGGTALTVNGGSTAGPTYSGGVVGTNPWANIVY